MKLYIVMPVVNCLNFTKEAIESIHTESRVILIDNGSIDDTPKFGATHSVDQMTYGKTLEYIRNDPAKSVSASWNQGIKRAFEDTNCQYVAVLNNDIILHPKTLNHLMAYMDKTGYLMVTGDNVKDRMSLQTMLTLELPVPFTDFDLWPIDSWRAEGPDFSCYMISRETIRVIGWFDENYQGAYCEDWDYHRRIRAAYLHAKTHNDQDINPEKIHAKRLTTAPYYHYASQTLTWNVDKRQSISTYHSFNKDYYTRKWGASHNEAMDGQGNITPFGDATKNWRSI